MLHEWITTWFHWVADWGYLGVFFLMALESSIFFFFSKVFMQIFVFYHFHLNSLCHPRLIGRLKVK